MSEKIKLTGHLGRGIHQLKLLAKVDGSPSTTYKIETDLEYNIFYGNSLIGNNITPIEAIRLAGGPYLKVGAICEDVNMIVDHIANIPNYGLVITFKNDN